MDTGDSAGVSMLYGQGGWLAVLRPWEPYNGQRDGRYLEGDRLLWGSRERHYIRVQGHGMMSKMHPKSDQG